MKTGNYAETLIHKPCRKWPVGLPRFPVVSDPGTCRSVILNGRKLYLLDKRKDLRGLVEPGYTARGADPAEFLDEIARRLAPRRAGAAGPGAPCGAPGPASLFRRPSP